MTVTNGRIVYVGQGVTGEVVKTIDTASFAVMPGARDMFVNGTQI